MNSRLNNNHPLSLILGTALAVALPALSDVTVKVDSTQSWVGYVNIWATNGTGYLWGSAWGTADLRGAFVPTNSPSGWPLNTHLVLRPNTNTYNPDGYWNFPDGSPNKIVEANFYRDAGTAYAGQTVTFTGTLLSNTIPAIVGGNPPSGWEVLAVVKEYTSPGYGWVGMNTVPLSSPGPFTVSRAIAPGHIAQWGFLVKGPNTAPNSPNSFTGVGILVEDADPAITIQPVGATIVTGITTNLSVTAVGSATLAYQWKSNGVPLVNSAKYSGVDTRTLTIANTQVADSGTYTVTVSNTVTQATVDSAPAHVTVLDIVITTAPASQRVEQGSTVEFNVAATSSSALTYLWKSVIGGVTNNVGGPNASGTNTPTLTLSNVQMTNSGIYFVAITTGTGSAAVGATLVVKSYADYPNVLENPGFENDPNGLNESPWVRFEVSEPTFGHLQKATDTYYGGGFVNIHQGTYVSYTTYNGAYSGIYQDVPASPGQIFAADMWFYNATGDPIPGPDYSATNENYLEVQFRAGTDPMPIQQYTTPISSLSHTTPRDVWFQLQATNAGTYGYNPPTANARYLVAPPGTTSVRFQFTMHDVANSVGAGSIYYDSARLMLKLPVTVSASVTGDNIILSWKSLGSTDYQVQYKDTLDGEWQNLGDVVHGTGMTVTKSDSVSHAHRSYRVLTL